MYKNSSIYRNMFSQHTFRSSWFWVGKYHNRNSKLSSMSRMFKNGFTFIKEHNVISIGAALIGSRFYLIVTYIAYLLRGGQLGIFLILGILMCIIYTWYYIIKSFWRQKNDIYALVTDDTIRLMFVTLIALCGYQQAIYRTGILRCIVPLLLAYMMIVFLRQSWMQVWISVGLWYICYFLLSQAIFPSLNR